LHLVVKDSGIHGSRAKHVQNATNIWFGGIDGSELLATLDMMGVWLQADRLASLKYAIRRTSSWQWA
jgi:hypothetical protein